MPIYKEKRHTFLGDIFAVNRGLYLSVVLFKAVALSLVLVQYIFPILASLSRRLLTSNCKNKLSFFCYIHLYCCKINTTHNNFYFQWHTAWSSFSMECLDKNEFKTYMPYSNNVPMGRTSTWSKSMPTPLFDLVICIC